MKILAKYCSAATQVHNGKCFFIGCQMDNGKVYNIEGGGTGGNDNKVWDTDESKQIVLPKPGVECSNGLYISNDGLIYYSLG